MNISVKNLKVLSKVSFAFSIFLICIALYYVWRNDNGPSGVLPALLAFFPLIISVSLANAAKKKDQESKNV